MQRIGIPFNIIESVDSTNRLALEKAMSGTETSGVTFFALEQTAGKGQRGRKWSSETGVNITMSILWEPKGLHSSDIFRLSCAAALAATDLFSKYAGEETAIKWPNDIYWRDRKAGGILIENIIRGQQWRWAVIGFGININQTHFDPELPNPVSLRQITGKSFDPRILARELCTHLHDRLESLSKTDFRTLLDIYQDRLYGRGRRFKFQHQDHLFNALVKGVNEAGELITENDSISTHRFGDISWLGPSE